MEQQQDVIMQDPGPADPPAPSLESILAESVPAICALRLDDLEKLFLDLILPDLRPPDDFLAPLSVKARRWALLGCILVFLLSHGKIVPRTFQLEAVLGSMENRDGIISSGTGSGKTLIMVMLQLLCPTDICLLVVPLKRLQYSQLEAFLSYGIKAVVVNEDTPDDPELWQVFVFCL